MHLSLIIKEHLFNDCKSTVFPEIHFWPIVTQICPNLVHLTHFVTGVGSSNLKYVLAVVITVRNLL